MRTQLEPERRVLTSEERNKAEAERKAKILALPQFTLIRLGWITHSGRVQGSIFYRIGEGLGPTDRDHGSEEVLTRELQSSHLPWTDQEWGIEILAFPPELCMNMGPRIGNDGAPRCKLPKGHTSNVHRPAPEDGWGNLLW